MNLSLIDVAVLIVAVLHLLFMILEMHLWTKPCGMKLFRMDESFAKRSATLASNQGLYNGMLAAGLIYGLYAGADDVIRFLLAMIIIVGVYGGMTISRMILIVQSLPAAIALGLLVIDRV